MMNLHLSRTERLLCALGLHPGIFPEDALGGGVPGDIVSCCRCRRRWRLTYDGISPGRERVR